MRSSVVVLALVAAACNPIQTAFPTAPTTAPPTAARPAVYAIELQAPRSPDFTSGAGVIGVRTRDVSGALVGADVTCTTTSGQLFPARFDSTFRPTIELVSTTVPARVHCASGDIEASIDVDMSAWGIDLGYQEFDPGPGPRAGETRVLLLPRPRIAGVAAQRLSIAWGDGTSSDSPLMTPCGGGQGQGRPPFAGEELRVRGTLRGRRKLRAIAARVTETARRSARECAGWMSGHRSNIEQHRRVRNVRSELWSGDRNALRMQSVRCGGGVV